MPAHCSPNIYHFPLPDGPLLAPKASENPALVFRMAADLIEAEAWSDHREAFRILVQRGHPSFYVAHLIDDARQLAAQCFASAETGES